jgi:hypothetical protein
MFVPKRVGGWLQALRDRKARALSDAHTDIVVLYKKRLITVEGKGNSISKISAFIESRVTVPLKIYIPLGTYFVKSGDYQNMVTRTEYEFELDPRWGKHISIDASCINANRPIPTSSDKFRGVARVPEKLSRFLVEAAAEDDMTIQAGVWAITDRYTRRDLESRLRRRKRMDLREHMEAQSRANMTASILGRSAHQMPVDDDGPAISDRQIDRAKALLDKLGIKNRL